MQLTYDPKYNIAYILFKEKREQVNSIKLSEDIIVDISPDGTLYGIELLNARKLLKGRKRKRLTMRNNSTGKDIEVELPF